MNLAVLPLLLPAAALGQTLISTDFSAAFTPVRGNERATGELPRGWVENSGWAQTWMTYSQALENGHAFLRIDVTRHDDGACQIYAPVPRSAAGGYFRLRLTVRNPDHLSITMGVRKLAAPYNFLWQMSHAWPADWRDYTYYARLGAADYDFALFLIIDSVGRFDVARLQLDAVTIEDIQRDFTGAPAGPAKNLVRNSRFPLGLQSGWTLDRESSDGDIVQIASDGTALHVTAPRKMQIYSEPVALPQPVGRHTASVYLRGKATGVLAAVGDGALLGSKAFTLDGGDWQRVEVSFTPNLLGRAHGVRIEATGELWMDRLQLERAPVASAWEPPAASEVALAVDSPMRVQFDDEEPLVRYAVTGASGTVRSRVADLYGSTRVLDASGGTIRYDVFPGRPLGTFRVEAWVEDDEGNRISPYNELVVLRLRRPRYWLSDAPDSPFGVHTLSTSRHILAAKAAGINWTRMHDAGTEYTGWYHLERQSGQWTTRDQDLWRYRDLGMKILGAFATAPEWASYFDKPRNGYFDRYYLPREWDPFANYARLIAERYYGVIDTWDIWNEPWGAGYFAVGYDEARKAYVTSDNPQRDFSRMTRVAADAARVSDPAAVIVGLNSTTGATGTAWTRGIAAEGGIEPADILCYHQYMSELAGFPGDIVEKGFQQAVGQVIASGKPVWMTEGSSVSGRTGNGLYRYTVPWEEEEDPADTGDRLVRFVVSLLAQGVRKTFLYSMHTHVWFGMGNQYRVLVNEDGYLHPSAAAHSAMAWLLEDTRFVRAVPAGEGVTAYLFQGDGRAVAVLSPRTASARVSVSGAAMYDLFGNPVPGGVLTGGHVGYAVVEGSAEDLALK